MTDHREQLLLRMYDQMFSDINQHITVVWQSIGTMVGAFALLALAEKNVVPIDVSVALIVLLSGWLSANLLDASYWYNRNLIIIANIERQFLRQDDLHSIHYYFGSHRKSNKMLTHLKIQMFLGVGLGFLILAYHYYDRVMPGLSAPWSNFDFVRSLPYVVALAAAAFSRYLWAHREVSYKEFLQNSPGKEIESSTVEIGVGHGADQNEQTVWDVFWGKKLAK